MTERERLLEKLGKVKALADRGEGGEKESAERTLAALMKRYGITEEDLEDTKATIHWIRYKTDWERRLLGQLAYMHLGTGHSFGCVGQYTGRSRKKVGIKCTAAQYIEIEADFAFYNEAMKEEMELFYSAFLQKKQAFPAAGAGRGTNRGGKRGMGRYGTDVEDPLHDERDGPAHATQGPGGRRIGADHGQKTGAPGQAGDRNGGGADAADNIRGGARKGDPAAQAGAGGLYPPIGPVSHCGLSCSRENHQGNLSGCGGITMNFLEMNGLQTAQTHFKDIFQNNIHRDYADAMLDWLEQETDFFTAPSSTKYHGAHPGGLLVHSLNVYYRLRNIAIRDLADKEDPGKCRLSEEQEETVAVIALLHDVCKVGCYHMETKRRKNPETGRWEDYEGYTYKDPLPLGHGEKSLYLIQRHMVLLPEEALAIRRHMGAYDDAAKADSRAMAAAMAASPWVWRLQEADMCAAWIDEREAGQ